MYSHLHPYSLLTRLRTFFISHFLSLWRFLSWPARGGINQSQPVHVRHPLTTKQREQRRDDFIASINKDAVATLASRFHNNERCSISPDVKHGSYNVCFFVTFPTDGTEWVVRIPVSPLISDVWAKVQSEVATMQYVQRETQIPIPTVHGYGQGERLTEDASTSQAFLIMDKMPGESLRTEEFLAISRESRIFLFAQLGDILGQLQQLHFPRSGSLYPDSKSSAKFAIGNPLHLIENDNAVNVGGYEKSWTSFSNAFDAVKGMFSILKHAYEIPIADEVPDTTIKRELLAIDSLASSLSDNTHPFWSLDAPFMLSHGDLRCENIMVDENMKIKAIIDWEWVVILPQQLCTPPPWVFGQNSIRNFHNREIFQEFQSAITQDNTYHEYLQYWRSNEKHLPLAQILRHPHLLTNIYYADVFPRLHRDPFAVVAASFFANEEHRKELQDRLTAAERYNEYLKENDLYVVNEVWKNQQEWVEKADQLLLEVTIFLDLLFQLVTFNFRRLHAFWPDLCTLGWQSKHLTPTKAERGLEGGAPKEGSWTILINLMDQKKRKFHTPLY